VRIAIVAPPWVGIPPPAYGGTETVLDTLARGLHAAGHEVLLFTTGDSTCPVPKAWVFDQAVGVGIGGAATELNCATSSMPMRRPPTSISSMTTRWWVRSTRSGFLGCRW